MHSFFKINNTLFASKLQSRNCRSLSETHSWFDPDLINQIKSDSTGYVPFQSF